MGTSNQAVFLSYASQDADAARRICDELRAAGLEVWFDQNELRGGDAWDASIRKQIKECALFVPLISANTDARSEGYFRREWNLAVDRMLDMADDQAFLLPVAIDDTPEALARVPDRFRERQWSRLANGETPPEFVARVSRLLAGGATSTKMPPRAPRTGATRRKRARLVAVAGLSATLITGGVAINVWHGRTAQGVPSAKETVATVKAPDRKSVAVLPFDNLSGRAEDAYLADGLHEEVLNSLARLRDLKVISRTSMMEYRGKATNVREIGQRLGVGTILEGSVRRVGNTLRLTVQVIDAGSDRHLLATNYDRDVGHVLDLQSTVARQVSDALAATLTQYEKGELDRVATNSGDAYDRYLRAVALYRRPVPGDDQGMVEPKRLLREALSFDPDYADALALLSMTNTWSYLFSARPEDGVAAKQAFERALAIDPKLPEAQLARGLYTLYVGQNLDQALVELAAVVQLRPNAAEAHAALGYALRRRGRMDEALDHLVRAWDLDPLNPAYDGGPIVTLLGLRRYPEAIEQTKLDATRFPGDPEPFFFRARIEGRIQRSVEPLRMALRDHGNQLEPPARIGIEYEIARAEGRYADALRRLESIPAEDPLARGERMGFLYLAAGDPRRAEKSFRDAETFALKLLEKEPRRNGLEEFSRPLAMVQSMLGKHAAALATIESARTSSPESRDATNGPVISFTRSVILVRAGRSEEGYAEVARLLRVPFGSPINFAYGDPEPVLLILKDDPHYDELINRPPRL